MRKVDWLIVVLVAAVMVFGIVLAAKADPAPPAKKCMAVADFSANIKASGGSVTPLAASGFAKATKILRAMPRHESVEADTAFFEEMPDGSSGITFAKGPCTTGIWLTPTFIPSARLKAILLAPESPAKSDREWL